MVGPRPVFRISVRVERDCEGLQPVIQISRDSWRSVERSWDMRESPRWWQVVTGSALDKLILLHCPESLPEDAWEWRARVAAADRTIEAQRSYVFRVDGTPPAEVDGLRLQRRPDASTLLTWNPVLYDIEGKPETVDHYVIYRYGSRGTFPQAPLMKIGQTQSLSFVDRQAVLPKTGRREGAAGAPRGQPDPRRSSARPGRAPSQGAQDAGGAPDSSGTVPLAAVAAEKEGGSTGRPKPATPPGRGEAHGKPGPGAGLDGEDRTAHEGSAVYYKVVAVDAAGNELGVRGLTTPGGAGAASDLR